MELLNASSLAFPSIGNQQSARAPTKVRSIGGGTPSYIYRYRCLFCDTTGKQVIRLLIADCYLLSRRESYLKRQQFSESGFERFSKATEWKFYFQA